MKTKMMVFFKVGNAAAEPLLLVCAVFLKFSEIFVCIIYQEILCSCKSLLFITDSLSLNFTDTSNGTEDPLTVGLLKKNIAWSTDINSKYKNPTDYINATQPGKCSLLIFQ